MTHGETPEALAKIIAKLPSKLVMILMNIMINTNDLEQPHNEEEADP